MFTGFLGSRLSAGKRERHRLFRTGESEFYINKSRCRLKDIVNLFADSGIGIDDAIRPYLFEAGYSMKIPPSGLGLYICKAYMNAMNLLREIDMISVID